SVKPRKDLRKGILKKADGSKSKPRMAVRWVAGDITSTKVVDRWIVPHEHIAPNMDRITGTIWGWKATPLGEQMALEASSNWWRGIFGSPVSHTPFQTMRALAKHAILILLPAGAWYSLRSFDLLAGDLRAPGKS
ncbi:MAG: hypothetical protein Q9203_007547, partial [Teloschistes exilis]